MALMPCPYFYAPNHARLKVIRGRHNYARG